MSTQTFSQTRIVLVNQIRCLTQGCKAAAPFFVRRLAIVLTTLAMVAPLQVARSGTAEAHAQRHLAAAILSINISCFPPSHRICVAKGRVRVFNRRPPGTGVTVICVGVDVITASGKILSLEPPLPLGEAAISLRPRSSGVTRYKTIYDSDAGVAKKVRPTHVHKYIGQFPLSGEQC